MGLREDILSDPECATALAARDCQELARIRSVGRVKRSTKMISERGVRAALSIAAGSHFIRLLKDASETVGVPAWLAGALTGMGVPADSHQDYADAIASAYGWLRQDSGLDLGSTATRGLLDLIAASDPSKFGPTVTTLKTLADQPDPLTAQQVAEAMFNIDGSLK
jgi:hypothetical protein